jgi:ADP-dependent NAD(P)H-hydrate dehydratase / NAD(P)H-hydrate epimerase
MTMTLLYNKSTIALLDQQMIKHYVPSAYDLMTRAAQSVLDVILQRFSGISSLVIFCGQGNNAGDGYVLARLASLKKVKITVISLVDIEALSGDALSAYNDWLKVGKVLFYESDQRIAEKCISASDMIVDAILGTGLNRSLNASWNHIINRINQHQSTIPVVSIDIPSGLDADTGKLWGETIAADLTITFIGKKLGMYTGQARNYCGEIIFKSLAVPDNLYHQYSSSASLLSWHQLEKKIIPRLKSSHKGDYGKLLIIGGNISMPGAVMLAGQAALRSGTGIVKILTHSENILAIQANHPELMVHGISGRNFDKVYLSSLLNWADAIAIGPGIGTDSWAAELLDRTLNYLIDEPEKPLVLDADALNLLATNGNLKHTNSVITPHPGEAARLLDTAIEQIEFDRYASIKKIQQNYAATVVLKGAGSLIADQSGISVCPYGNAGMATAGMGDCLTGILSALLAQGYSNSLAAKIAVCLHARAADLAAEKGETGMISSDILPFIRDLLL